MGDRVLEALVFLGDAFAAHAHHHGGQDAQAALNSKIQTIKKMAYGFRNVDHCKTAIYFHCGGLQLYPPVVRTATAATRGNPG